MANWTHKLIRGWSIALILALLAIPVLASKGDTVRVTLATDGTQADNSSYGARISPEGQYVVFESYATNLVSGDTNAKTDIFMRNIQGNTTIRISVASEGTQANNSSLNPSVSNNGRYVVFDSTATNLVSGDTNAKADVFLRDTLLNTTMRISVATDGSQGNNDSSYPSITPDGRYVVFMSKADNLVTGDTNGFTDIFVRDLLLNTTTRASLANDGAEANATSANSQPSISSNGRFVVFESNATNLVTGDTNVFGDVFLRDTQSNTTIRLSVTTDGVQGNQRSRNPVISSDGRYVAFDSNSNNLIASDTNGVGDVFLRDTLSNTTIRVSIAGDGSQALLISTSPSISENGRYIAFMSQSNLVSGDKNGKYDVFIRDVLTNTTTRVSIASDGTQGNDASAYPSISSDGQFIAFLSDATNLVPDDTNAIQDAFVHERGGIYITAADPNPTSASSVHFVVTFAQPMLNVDVNDFSLTTTGTLTGTGVTNVTGAGALYTVTVNTGTGEGTLRLDIPSGATITNNVGDPLTGLPFTRGEVYIVDRTLPQVQSIDRNSNNPSGATTVNFLVTFSEDMTNVSIADFEITKTGTISGESIVSVTGGGPTRSVTVNTGTGIGTLRLDIPDSATITDLANNPITNIPFTSGQIYTIRVQTFADVPPSHWAYSWIERLYAAGITGGCGTNPLRYCPENPVTRAQMAIFLERGMWGSDFIPPEGTGMIFSDVDSTNPFVDWIERLYADGITGGCGINPLRYCPGNPVTRAQMAIFLLRSEHGAGYVPPAAKGIFNDVPTSHGAANWIEQLYNEAITAGCGAGNYCPNNPVTRAQMAVFLVRTFSLP